MSRWIFLPSSVSTPWRSVTVCFAVACSVAQRPAPVLPETPAVCQMTVPPKWEPIEAIPGGFTTHELAAAHA